MANRRRTRPASSPEAREAQLVSKAIDLAEKQIEEGTASAQVLSYYLKLGSSRESLEQERLRRENEKLKAQIETMASSSKIEELYTEAIAAMKRYSGNYDEEESEEMYDDEFD